MSKDITEVYEPLNKTALKELSEEGKTNTGNFKMNLEEWTDKDILELSNLLNDIFVERNS
jgi:hypothetical protein